MKLIITTLTMIFVLTACGPNFRVASIDETGAESATELIPFPQRAPAADVSSVEMRILRVSQSTNVRKLVNNVLEFLVELPPGSTILVPADYQIVQPDFRNSTGVVERSSTGFVGGVKIAATPAGAGHLSAAQIDQFNKTNQYVTASIAGTIEGVAGSFKTISGATPSKSFLEIYSAGGQPSITFSAALKKRFAARLNQAAAASADTVARSAKIYAELKRAGDRKVATRKSLILVDKETAAKFSKAYESSGVVAENGAWTIAVTQTAVRHGFENVPCAEFQSELLRQAYQRAGLSAATDFNATRGNQLIWSKTAAVSGLSNALYIAGWVPWEPSKFRPPTGAIMMHGSGGSPGHAYMAGGDDGRIIVDNGSPQGRDLRVTSSAILKMMYETGVFFLPPGVNPKPW